MSRSSLMLLALLLGTACGSNDENETNNNEPGGMSGGGGTAGEGTAGGTATGGTGATTGTGGGSAGSTPVGDSFSLDIGPIKVTPGQENTQCIVKRLGNPNSINVGRIHNSISSSSHHLIVYRTNATEEKLEPFDCTPFLETLDPETGSTLMVTQKYEDTLQLPPGVAFTLEPNQMIRLELHYINTAPTDVDVIATSTFTELPADQFEHEADFLFIGSPDINIPPNSASTLGPVYFPMPSEFADVNFFAITGHTHQYGTNVSVLSSSGPNEPGTNVYDVPNWQWDEPETVTHDPPFQIPSGGGFHFQCDWQNTSSQQVQFGESANAEMCFFWAYYYPSKGARICFHTDQFAGGIDLCCPGHFACDAISGFL